MKLPNLSRVSIIYSYMRATKHTCPNKAKPFPFYSLVLFI